MCVTKRFPFTYGTSFYVRGKAFPVYLWDDILICSAVCFPFTHRTSFYVLDKAFPFSYMTWWHVLDKSFPTQDIVSCPWQSISHLHIGHRVMSLTNRFPLTYRTSCRVLDKSFPIYLKDIVSCPWQIVSYIPTGRHLTSWLNFNFWCIYTRIKVFKMSIPSEFSLSSRIPCKESCASSTDSLAGNRFKRSVDFLVDFVRWVRLWRFCLDPRTLSECICGTYSWVAVSLEICLWQFQPRCNTLWLTGLKAPTN